ncbi:hypothetical protein NDU88_006933 [Pleurodeles waltl]|uniref:Uncharacterized protein n=1 Tax=Pleurodeles waltl TaxID=8319 RepID=A0AAV7MH77_PLEWA|nr:hypothetical protein NDU88_006933 [Pleurodeles waltl]
MQALCPGLQEQGTGSAYRERDASAVNWPAGAGLAVHTASMMQALCTGLQEQVTGGAYRECDASAVHWVQEQVTGGAYRERDASAGPWPAGAGYWRCIQRA